jgi:hypothetical protein
MTWFNGMLIGDAEWIQLAHWSLVACLRKNCNKPSGTIKPDEF